MNGVFTRGPRINMIMLIGDLVVIVAAEDAYVAMSSLWLRVGNFWRCSSLNRMAWSISPL